MTPQARIWVYRVLYFLLGLFAVAYPLLPLQFSPARFSSPDLLFALTMVWIVRQPQSAPFLLVAALALLADAVLMRPMGLWAVLMLISSETVRFSYKSIQDRGIIAEFTLIASLLLAMVVLQNLVLWVSFSQVLEFAKIVQFVILTLASIPVILLFLHYVVRVRKPDSRNRPDRLGKIR